MGCGIDISVTESGGRRVRGMTPLGNFEIEWDKNGKLVREKLQFGPNREQAERDARQREQEQRDGL